jgi:transglutaminase-like putative cysteine protease
MRPSHRQDGTGRLYLLTLLLTCCWTASPVAAQEARPPQPAGQPLHEFWEAVHLQGSHIGYAHGVFHKTKEGMIRGEEEMHLTLTRFGQSMKMDFRISMTESEKGQVRQFSIRQTLGRDEEVIRSGVIQDGRVKLTTILGRNPPKEESYDWNDKAIGLFAQEKLYAGRGLKPGLVFDFVSFVPEFNIVLATQVKIGEKQPTELLGNRKHAFWRATMQVEKINNITMPALVCWVNDDGEVYKREQFFPGLGDVAFYRTSKDRARNPGAGAVATADTDIGYSQLVRANRSIPGFNETRSVTYRASIKDADDIESMFAKDDRQTLKVINKNEVEVTVTVPDPPAQPVRAVGAPPADHLKSNHFLASEDPNVVRFARDATAGVTDPWHKALRIERWVRDRMTNKDYGKAFATAAETARTLDGDCTEHAVLAAAMCRAAGVPSRTAIGLVHVPADRAMCFHMWFEVWINGKWYSLDATLGQGRVGAGHLKVLDAHWNGTDSFLPLLPVVRLLGKLKLDILSVEYQPGVSPR